ncbi:hypothetical protein J6590_003833 [Homalodisca vitripennis]|nr:hypothetical protein J6590_003833 [Homalodisca vitripennis]
MLTSCKHVFPTGKDGLGLRSGEDLSASKAIRAVRSAARPGTAVPVAPGFH